MSNLETSYYTLPLKLSPQLKRIRESSQIKQNTSWIKDEVQPFYGKLEKRRIVKLASVGYFNPRELEQQRNSSIGNEPHLDYDTENLYQVSRTANQLEELRISPTSITGLNINNSTILRRRNK